MQSDTEDHSTDTESTGSLIESSKLFRISHVETIDSMPLDHKHVIKMENKKTRKRKRGEKVVEGENGEIVSVKTKSETGGRGKKRKIQEGDEIKRCKKENKDDIIAKKDNEYLLDKDLMESESETMMERKKNDRKEDICVEETIIVETITMDTVTDEKKTRKQKKKKKCKENENDFKVNKKKKKDKKIENGAMEEATILKPKSLKQKKKKKEKKRQNDAEQETVESIADKTEAVRAKKKKKKRKTKSLDDAADQPGGGTEDGKRKKKKHKKVI